MGAGSRKRVLIRSASEALIWCSFYFGNKDPIFGVLKVERIFGPLEFSMRKTFIYFVLIRILFRIDSNVKTPLRFIFFQAKMVVSYSWCVC